MIHKILLFNLSVTRAWRPQLLAQASGSIVVEFNGDTAGESVDKRECLERLNSNMAA